MDSRSYRRAGWAALLTAAAAGCGSDPLVVVTGRVVEGGRPVAVGPSEEMFVVLVGNRAEGKLGYSFPAAVGRDGTFTVSGPDGRGVPPGSYAVVVYTNTVDPARPAATPTDRYRRAFRSENTPLRCDVAPSQAAFVVDLGKKSVEPDRR